MHYARRKARRLDLTRPMRQERLSDFIWTGRSRHGDVARAARAADSTAAPRHAAPKRTARNARQR